MKKEINNVKMKKIPSGVTGYPVINKISITIGTNTPAKINEGLKYLNISGREISLGFDE
jgi:hypothetical protein